jgi:hypothetical protein
MIKEFRVNRSKWLNGSNREGESSTLLDSKGNMCVLGAYCYQSGISKARLSRGFTPASMFDYTLRGLKSSFITKISESLGFLLEIDNKDVYNNNTCANIMSINDAKLGSFYVEYVKGMPAKQLKLNSDIEREQLLKKEFKKLGISLEFYGEYPPKG